MTEWLSEIERARLVLARSAHVTDPSLVRSLYQAACIAASTLNVDRVGIWVIEENWRRLRCLVSSDGITSEPLAVLDLEAFPEYTRALKERRVIAATDAMTDERTRELSASYLVPLGIVSLLDCPVYDAGEVIAIVCHEARGEPRHFSERDRDFAASVADIVATLFSQAARLRMEEELRSTREELAQARVMDSLGRMAAGVAHDLNNVLSGISLSNEFLKSELPASSPAREAAQEISGLVEQGARLVRFLLTFARQGAHHGSPVEIHAVLRDLFPRLRRTLGPDVLLDVDLDERLAVVLLDAPVVEQVFQNLILNAKEAMPGGGRITIRSIVAEGRLKVTVRDNGVGMAPETCQHIFEPFFTTKEENGTGLGLAIVFGAVRGAGGTVSVQSERGHGTVFTLEFPLVDASRP